MRKKNKVFLILAVLLVGLMISACTRSAVNQNSAGNDNAGAGDQLSAIMTNVAASTPVGELTPGGDDQGFVGPDQTPQGIVTEEPTATPVPPTATPTVTPAEMVVPTTYTLHKGEYPYCLARRFDVDVDSLLSANNLARGATYYEGLKLTIPTSSSGFKGERALMTHPVMYTVMAGDTFYTIACRYGDVYPEEIASANGMTMSDTLQAGTQLSIP